MPKQQIDMARKEVVKDASTEEKIKDAARRLFTQKGYAAIKTRDIAAEAGINMALLHYYFRSKEKLFELIMMENLQQFIAGMQHLLTNEKTSLEEKVTAFVDNYIDLLTRQPDLPLFIFSEIRANPAKFISKIKIREFLPGSHFMKQFQELMKKNKTKLHPLHFLMNLAGLAVFPFIGAPLIQNIGNINQAEFDALMQQRKKLIPVWIKMMLTTS